MKLTVKALIVQYLSENYGWQFGGKIDREVGDWGHVKESNVSRRCRELVTAGVILRQIVPFEGRRVVQYKLNQTDERQTSLFETETHQGISA